MENEDLEVHNDKMMAMIPALSGIQPGRQNIDVLLSGSAQTREIQIVTTSATSGSNLNNQLAFSYEFSNQVAIDQCIMLQVPLTVTVTTSANNAQIDYFSTKNDFALAQNPINRAIKTLQVKLNNNTVPTSNGIFASALQKYIDTPRYRQFQRTAQPDACNNYNANILFVGGNSNFNNITQDGFEQSRAAVMPDINVTAVAASGAKQVATFTWLLTEPLIHPFLTLPDNNHSSLFQIKNLNVDVVFNDLYSMFSGLVLYDTAGTPAPCVISTPSFATSIQPRLLVRTYVPVIEIPKTVSMVYNQMLMRPYNVSGAATPGATGQINTGSITYGQVPESIYLFGRQQQDIAGLVNSHPVADAWLVIDSLIMRNDSDAGAFSNASREQLFEMCCRNGLNQNYQQFKDLQGSVIKIDIARDTGAYLPGTLCNYTIDFTINVTNSTYSAFGIPNTLGAVSHRNGSTDSISTWQFYVLAIMSGSMIADGNSLVLQGGLSQGDVLDVVKQGFNYKYDPSQMAQHYANGSGFFGTARDFLKNSGRALLQNKNVRDIARKVATDVILPYTQKLAAGAAGSANPYAAAVGTFASPALGMVAEKYANKSDGSGMKIY